MTAYDIKAALHKSWWKFPTCLLLNRSW